MNTVRSASTAVADVAIVFGRARREGRPIVLILPSDLADEAYSGPPLGEQPLRRGERSAQRMVPEERTISLVAQQVLVARRPVILAGRPAIASGARDELVALGDEIGALLATTLPARSLFHGHPCDVGVAGGFGEGLANDLLPGADLVLAFGTSLSDYMSKGMSLFRHANVVQFDVDPTATSATGSVEHAVVGDARASAAALRAGLRDETRGAVGYRTQDVLETIAAHRPGEDLADESGPEALDPRTLALELDGTRRRTPSWTGRRGGPRLLHGRGLQVHRRERSAQVRLPDQLRLDRPRAGNGRGGPASPIAVFRPSRPSETVG